MKMSGKNIFLIIAVLLVAGIGIFFLTKKPKSVSPKVVATATASPTPKGISASDRAKVRTDYINNCVKTMGPTKTKVCSCSADYLSSHYSDLQLVKFYYEYHTLNETPQEIKDAVNACSSK